MFLRIEQDEKVLFPKHNFNDIKHVKWNRKLTCNIERVVLFINVFATARYCKKKNLSAPSIKFITSMFF
jgi:hypothetical protein